MGISYCVTNSFDLGSRYLIVTANADETSRERAREGKDEGMVGVAEEVATPGAGVADKIKGVGKATGAVVLGIAGLTNILIPATFY